MLLVGKTTSVQARISSSAAMKVIMTVVRPVHQATMTSTVQKPCVACKWTSQHCSFLFSCAFATCLWILLYISSSANTALQIAVIHWSLVLARIGARAGVEQLKLLEKHTATRVALRGESVLLLSGVVIGRRVKKRKRSPKSPTSQSYVLHKSCSSICI